MLDDESSTSYLKTNMKRQSEGYKDILEIMKNDLKGQK